ncbi:MAG: segregation/condensation protein A [candidate division Zixibacteria bacterium]|nr:segregation/condensation protein A [candidate division Zixibacteria bacterium]
MNMTTSQLPQDYRVDLPVFSGPLDLLLYLIKKEEVDIYDIPLARVTSQYLKYMELIQELNLDVAGEFVLMAATLIRAKARLLLPRDENDPEEIDPREELIMALVEYRKYREASEILREKALLEERNYVPPSPVGKIETKVDLSPGTSLFELLTAFREVLEAKRDEAFHSVDAEEISIEDRITVIMGMLKQQEFATFPELFSDVPRRIVAIVTFIALLELVRVHRVSIYQSVSFGEMRVYRGKEFEAPRRSMDIIDFTQSQPQMVSN